MSLPAADRPRPVSTNAFLAALQLADSSLPIGRFVHSHGLERWLAVNPDAASDELAELVATTVLEAVGPLDATAVVLAHRAPSTAGLIELDALVTAHKLIAANRAASRSCGRQLAALGCGITDDALSGSFCGLVASDRADGNLAIVEGTLMRALGLSSEQAALVELRGTVVSMVSAAVRLGRLSAIQAQLMLCSLAPTIERAGADALVRGPDDLHATCPELDLAALSHRRADARSFAT